MMIVALCKHYLVQLWLRKLCILCCLWTVSYHNCIYMHYLLVNIYFKHIYILNWWIICGIFLWSYTVSMEFCVGVICFCTNLVATLLYDEETCMYFVLTDTKLIGYGHLCTIFSWGMHCREEGALDLEDLFIIHRHTYHNGDITYAI